MKRITKNTEREELIRYIGKLEGKLEVAQEKINELEDSFAESKTKYRLRFEEEQK